MARRDEPRPELTDDIPESVMNELLEAFAEGPVATPKPTAEPAPPAPEAVAAEPEGPDKGAGTGEDAGEAERAEGPEQPAAVVVIEVDELPDAVVLDGDTSSGVVINDDGGGSISTATSTRVDPRFRARRIAVRRAEGRRRLRWMVIAAVVVLLAVGVLVVLASPLFAIDNVQVEGNVYTDPAALDAIVDRLEGEPILTADLDAARRELEAIPWVADARVTMHFPHTVRIQIAERTPVASFQGTDGQFRVVDVDGRVLDVLAGQPVDYLLISGVSPNTDAGSNAGLALRGAAQLVSALPPALHERVSRVELTPTGETTLILDGGDTPEITVSFGAPEDYRNKLIALLNEMTRLANTPYSEIDVSTGNPISK